MKEKNIIEFRCFVCGKNYKIPKEETRLSRDDAAEQFDYVAIAKCPRCGRLMRKPI